MEEKGASLDNALFQLPFKTFHFAETTLAVCIEVVEVAPSQRAALARELLLEAERRPAIVYVRLPSLWPVFELARSLIISFLGRITRVSMPAFRAHRHGDVGAALPVAAHNVKAHTMHCTRPCGFHGGERRSQ